MDSHCPDPITFDRFCRDEFGAGEKGAWENHLAVCSKCLQLMIVERELQQQIGSMPAPRLSIGFERRLQARIHAQERRNASARLKRLVLWTYWALALVAGTLVLKSLEGSPQLSIEASAAALLFPVLICILLMSRTRLRISDLILHAIYGN